MPKHDDFQLLEIVRPNAQDRKLQNPPKHHVTEREEHEASCVVRQPRLFYAFDPRLFHTKPETGLRIYAPFRVFGLTNWYRDGTLTEYVAIEARNLSPLPGDVDFTVGASLPISGLTAWQGLFEHGRLQAGQSVLVHGAGGAVGLLATRLAQEAGAYVIGTGRAADRQTVLDFGAKEFVDLENAVLEDVGGVDLVFDVIGGNIGKRSAGLIRAGGTPVSIVGPPEARPADGVAVDLLSSPIARNSVRSFSG